MNRKCNASGITDTGDIWQCDKPTRRAIGLCEAHYTQSRRGKQLAKLRKSPRKLGKVQRHNPRDMFCVVPAGHRGCSMCGEIKPIEEFHISNTRTDGLSASCKICDNASCTERKHGDGAVEWKREQFKRQGYVCEICKTDKSGGKNWHLHHNPRYEGRDSWRAVLCQNCNSSAVAGLENSKNPKALLKWLYDNFEDITGQEPPELS